jgi:hypothetical protein
MTLSCELGPVGSPSTDGGEAKMSGATAYLQLIDEYRDGVEFIVLVLTLHRVCAVCVLR